MKIGILTFHWATNYGAVLQTYALQSYLLQKGHEVEVINYKPNVYDWSLIRYIKKPRLLKNFLRDYRLHLKDKRIDAFREKFLHLTKRYNSTDEVISANLSFDVLISGSDQVLNPRFTLLGEGSPTSIYYLPFCEHSKRIGYAISFGCVEYPEEAKQFATRWINNFDSIGVREDSGCSILTALDYKGRVDVVPDPTVLLGKDLFRTIIAEVPASSNKYCVYMLRRRITLPIPDVIYIDEASRLYTMEEWICTIASSKGLITNSYHGMIMALLNHVPFVVQLEKGHHSGMNDRFRTLLSRIGLLSRINNEEALCISILESEINWEMVDKRLMDFRKNGEELFVDLILN